MRNFATAGGAHQRPCDLRGYAHSAYCAKNINHVSRDMVYFNRNYKFDYLLGNIYISNNKSAQS